MMIAIIAGVVIFFLAGPLAKSGRTKMSLFKENIPENLGLLNDVPAEALIAKLDNALPYEYLN